MKYLQSLILLLVFIWGFSFSQGTYASLQTTQAQILEMKSWERFIKKLDAIALKVSNKAKKEAHILENISKKIETFKMRYQNNSDTKSKNILAILDYLELKIQDEMGKRSSRLLERLQKVETDAYKSKATSRTNTLKQKKYTRIQIKK